VLKLFADYGKGGAFEAAFQQRFDAPPPEELNTGHRLTIIASAVDVTVTVARDGGYFPAPAEFGVAAEQAASSQAASVVSAHTAEQIISVVTVETCVPSPIRLLYERLQYHPNASSSIAVHRDLLRITQVPLQY
jgi:hypothetical protein